MGSEPVFPSAAPVFSSPDSTSPEHLSLSFPVVATPSGGRLVGLPLTLNAGCQAVCRSLYESVLSRADPSVLPSRTTHETSALLTVCAVGGGVLCIVRCWQPLCLLPLPTSSASPLPLPTFSEMRPRSSLAPRPLQQAGRPALPPFPSLLGHSPHCSQGMPGACLGLLTARCKDAV